MENEIQIISTILFNTLNVESRNEKERIKLSQSHDFYPEIAFNFLKYYERPKPKSNNNKLNDFFDFTQPPDTIQYNYISSLKEGFIDYERYMTFLYQYGISSTDKQLLGVFEQFSNQYQQIQQGVPYDIFIQFIAPFSVPQAKHDLLKRKVIYETKGLNEQIKENHLKILAEMIHVELDLLRHNSNLKLKLINEFNWEPLRSFEKIDMLDFIQIFIKNQQFVKILHNNRQGFLNFDSIQNLLRQFNQHFAPRDYLCLLKRMNKPEDQDTISFQDFNSFLQTNMPYFNPNTDGNQSLQNNKSQLYQTTNRFKHSPQKNQQSSIFNNPQSQSQYMNQSQAQYQSNKQDNLLFIDQQGRIIQKPHPQQILFAENLPEVNQIIKKNINLVQMDPNVYPILPPSQYDAQNYDPAYQPAIVNKKRQLEEKKEKNRFWTQTEQNMETNDDWRNEQRRKIFETKDQMMGTFNLQSKQKIAETHAMYGEIYKIAQNNTARKQLDTNPYQSNGGRQQNTVSRNMDNNQYKSQNLFDLQQSAMNITQFIQKDQTNQSMLRQKGFTGNQSVKNLISTQYQPYRADKQSKIFDQVSSPRTFQYQMTDTNPQPSRQIEK